MRRLLINFATAASLLLCLATIGLWVRSRYTADVVTYAGTRMLRVASHDGGVSIGSFRLVRRLGSWRNPAAPFTETPLDSARAAGTLQRWNWETIPAGSPTAATTRNVPPRLTDRVWNWPGGSVCPRVDDVERQRVARYNNVTGGLDQQVFVGPRLWMPYWVPLALAVLPPGLRLSARSRRARRAALDLCPDCGYDLRATPQGGRCPECGTIPARPTRHDPVPSNTGASGNA